MKKILVSFLILVLLLAVATTALAAKPGETVTVNISVTANANGAYAGGIGFTFDSSALEFVSAASSSSDVLAAPNSASSSFALMNISGISTGVKGTITFRVKANAAAGKYTVSAYGYDFVDVDENPVSVSVSGGTVTVEADDTVCTSHTWNSGSVKTEATCTAAGVMKYTCTKCGETKEEAIPQTDCIEGSAVETKKATCETAGEKTTSCKTCGKTLKTESIAALGHKEGESAVTKQPTCTAAGTKEIKCSRCGKSMKTESVDKVPHTEVKDKAVAATCTKTGLTEGKHCSVCDTVLVEQKTVEKIPHTKGSATVTKKATCTEKGLQSYKCTVCKAEIENEEIPATGHKEGKAEVTKQPTCTKKGSQVYKCTVCKEELRTESIPATGHTEGKAEVTKKPTCTKKGEQKIACKTCGETLKTEKIAATGHDSGKWVVTQAATQEKEGAKELQCTKCDYVLDKAAIPVVTTIYYTDNTACTMGPAFRDETSLTDKWFRFTPVDLSVDGTQTFDLIGSNLYIIGKVNVTVADGKVTVDCEYVSKDVKVKEEFCTFLPSLADVTTLEQSELKNFPFGEEISIADDLAGDTKVLLYICNVVDYDSDMPIQMIGLETKAFKETIEAMKALMD